MSRMHLRDRICELESCGVEFTPTGTRQRFHTAECKAKAAELAPKPVRTPKGSRPAGLDDVDTEESDVLHQAIRVPGAREPTALDLAEELLSAKQAQLRELGKKLIQQRTGLEQQIDRINQTMRKLGIAEAAPLAPVRARIPAEEVTRRNSVD